MAFDKRVNDIGLGILALEKEIDAAQAQRDHSRANDLFKQQQLLYRLLPDGGEPCVGEGGRAV